MESELFYHVLDRNHNWSKNERLLEQALRKTASFCEDTIKALVLLMELGVIEDIENAMFIDEKMYYVFFDSLVNNYGVDREVSDHAIHLWFDVYGNRIRRKPTQYAEGVFGVWERYEPNDPVNMFNQQIDAMLENMDRSHRYRFEGENTCEYPEKVTSLSLILSNKDGFDFSLFPNVEELYVSHSYDGIIPEVGTWKLKRFSSTRTIKWEELTALPFDNVTDLSICVTASDRPVKLAMPKLRKLQINYREEEGKENLINSVLVLDYYTCLEEVVIRHGAIQDDSQIKLPETLTSLIVVDGNVEGLKWINGYNDSLQKLFVVSCGLKSLVGIEVLANLKSVDLSRNEITSIEPLKGLSAIEELDLSRNQVEDFSALTGLHRLKKLNIAKNRTAADALPGGRDGHVSVIRTDEDYALDRVVRNNMLIQRACSSQQHNDKQSIDTIPAFKRDRIAIRREYSFHYRVREEFQLLVNQEAYKLCPSSFYEFDEYTPDTKRRYFDLMKGQYPFIHMEEFVEKQIERELIHTCDDCDTVFICKDNVLSIAIEKAKDTDGIKIPYTTQTDLEKLWRFITTNWSEYCEKPISRTGYSLDVVYKYSSKVEIEDIYYLILLSLILYENNINSQGFVVIADFRKDGKIKQNKVRRRNLYCAKYEHAKVAIIYGGIDTYEEGFLEGFDLRYEFAKTFSDIINIFESSNE